LNALSAIWPGISLKQFQKAFKDAETITVTLDEPKIEINGNTARAICKQTISIVVNGKRPSTDVVTKTFVLRRVQGGWIIVQD
jgi:hypothetical protein